jgi:predicted ATPase
VERLNFFIISGAPGAGKTTLIERLAARGFATVAEAGRAILREQAEAAFGAGQDGDPAAFGEAMLARAVANYRGVTETDEPVFFDRGIAEAGIYWRLIGLPAPTTVRDAARNWRSNPLVLLAPPWREIYRRDAERIQSFDEAERTFELVRDAYVEAGYRPLEIAKDTVARRVGFVLAAVDAASDTSASFSPQCLAKWRKSLSRVISATSLSMHAWAIRASPRRAFRPRLCRARRATPARNQ